MRSNRCESIGALQEPPKTWVDLVGKRFGRLTVLGYTGVARNGHKQVTCQCDCGLFTHVMPTSLRSGATTSCSCMQSEKLIARNKAMVKHGDARGYKVTPEYRAWAAMISRCHSSTHAAYSLYGGRGITVCERWRSSFQDFLADVGRRPSRRHSLDRTNNDGNYEPGNVRWALPEEQVRNRRVTLRYLWKGEWLTIGEIATSTGISQDLLQQRIGKFHWTVEEAVTTPVGREVDEHGLYGRWYQMVSRCTDPVHERYADYGGRGIHVCDRWRESFDNFKKDIGLPPSSGAYTLDRIDNHGHYEPGNVRWATPLEQNRNRRSTKIYELYGEKRSLASWAERAGIDYTTVKRRVRGGWPLAEALGTPKGFGRCPSDARCAWQPVPAHEQWPHLDDAGKRQLVETTAIALSARGFPWDAVRTQQEKAPLVRVARGKIQVEGDEIQHVSQVGQATCLASHWHRLEARYRDRPSVVEAFSNPDALQRAVQFQLDHGDPVIARRVVRALSALYRSPLNFPPVLARWLIDQYAPAGGTVLDPCSGYGGRLLGAMASDKQVKYIGRDVEERSVQANLDLARSLGVVDRVQEEQAAVEDDIPWPDVDLVLTSPPYYDRENYGPAAERYLAPHRTYESWSNRFLRCLVERAVAASPTVILNVAAIHSGSVFHDLPSDVERYAKDAGARVDRTLVWQIAAFGRNRRHEKILIIRRA